MSILLIVIGCKLGESFSSLTILGIKVVLYCLALLGILSSHHLVKAIANSLLVRILRSAKVKLSGPADISLLKSAVQFLTSSDIMTP